MESLKDLPFEKLLTLLQAVTLLCDNYASMTDTYALTTGDAKFENISKDMYSLIADREKLFRFKQNIIEQLKQIIFTRYIDHGAE